MKLNYRTTQFKNGDSLVYQNVPKTAAEDDIYIDFIISDFDQFFSKVVNYFDVVFDTKSKRAIISIKNRTDISLLKIKYIFIFDKKYLNDLNSPIQFNSESISIYRPQFNVYEDVLYFNRETGATTNVETGDNNKDNAVWKDIRTFFKLLED
jgi:hypothetical protein